MRHGTHPRHPLAPAHTHTKASSSSSPHHTHAHTAKPTRRRTSSASSMQPRRMAAPVTRAQPPVCTASCRCICAGEQVGTERVFLSEARREQGRASADPMLPYGRFTVVDDCRFTVVDDPGVGWLHALRQLHIVHPPQCKLTTLASKDKHTQPSSTRWRHAPRAGSQAASLQVP
jgi:hypothetical protein